MSVLEDHMDVLQNIEFGVLKALEEEEALSDYDVQDAIEALIRVYKDQRGGSQSTRRLNLHEKAQVVYTQVKTFTEPRLGGEPSEEIDVVGSVSLEVMIECLQKIRNSVRRWNKKGGSRGYLSFIQKYIR